MGQSGVRPRGNLQTWANAESRARRRAQGKRGGTLSLRHRPPGEPTPGTAPHSRIASAATPTQQPVPRGPEQRGLGNRLGVADRLRPAMASPDRTGLNAVVTLADRFLALGLLRSGGGRQQHQGRSQHHRHDQRRRRPATLSSRIQQTEGRQRPGSSNAIASTMTPGDASVAQPAPLGCKPRPARARHDCAIARRRPTGRTGCLALSRTRRRQSGGQRGRQGGGQRGRETGHGDHRSD